MLIVLVAGIGLALPFLLSGRQPVADSQAHLFQPEFRPVAPPVPDVRRDIHRGTVQPGDTVTSLLGNFLTARQIHDLGNVSREIFPLSRICAGQPFALCTENGSFASFTYEIDREERLIIRRDGDGFSVNREAIPYVVERDLVQGTINSSLFEAVETAGEGPELAIALADIFAWDIDFLRDLRAGDTFQALVEKRFREGEQAGYGSVLAAEFINQGEVFRAIRFQDGERSPSYYDLEGNNLRKAFLKAPLSYSRISSGFTMKRFHPITKTWKAHPAIDYAAPTGTPIKSVGDGTIIRIGYTRGNGNYIKIRHNATYQTLYLHMSRFARGMKKGKRVAQGQVIGYVGSTGLATGPHLCFRMYRNGQPINPFRLKTPSAAAISPERLEAFRDHAAPLLAALNDDGNRRALNAQARDAEETSVIR